MENLVFLYYPVLSSGFCKEIYCLEYCNAWHFALWFPHLYKSFDLYTWTCTSFKCDWIWNRSIGSKNNARVFVCAFPLTWWVIHNKISLSHWFYLRTPRGVVGFLVPAHIRHFAARVQWPLSPYWGNRTHLHRDPHVGACPRQTASLLKGAGANISQGKCEMVSFQSG